MLRLFRSRMNPFSLGTRVHSSSGPSPQVIQVQRVHIRRKWFKPTNFVIAGCIYYCCYQVYKSSVLDTVDAYLDEQDKNLTKKEREEIEAEMLEPIFIPIPFTTRAVPSAPYKGTDPEWQNFIKVNKDEKLLGEIKRRLVELTLRTAASNIMLVQKCGRDMQAGRVWLDVQYPHRPPPHFHQKGIEIGDRGITISEDRIDTMAALWIERILWPSALTLSLWSFSGALVKQNISNFAKMLGYGSNSTPNPPLLQAMEKLQKTKKSATESDSSTPGSLPSTKTQAADGSSTNSTSVEKRSDESTSASGSSPTTPGSGMSSPIPVLPSAESGKSKSVRDIYGIEYLRDHTSEPWRAFKQKFTQTWRPIRGLPPRGVIYVGGLVEVTTSRAFITIDVHAFWDPKTRKYDMKTAMFRLRQIRMRTQVPAR